jgi:hypothetical protein
MTRAVFKARAASATALWLIAVATAVVCAAMILCNGLCLNACSYAMRALRGAEAFSS